MRRRVIAGNWKMHMTCAQARDYMGVFLPLIEATPDDRHVVLAPPFTAISTMAGLADGSRVQLASDEQINHRARCAQANGLIPIVCVGESDQQRERGEAERVIRRQIEQGLEGLDANRLVVAYEPIWAIGTGKTCEASEANRICGLIRSWVGAMDLVIQYGGSVKPANIDELMAMSDIDGVLVGGASLKPDGFARIANYQTP